MRFIILCLSLFLMPAVVMANEGGGEAKEAVGPQYLELTPKFTVNLTEPRKYLMVNVQLLIDGAATESVKKHMSAVRNDLILLFSGRSIATLQTSEQREALRKETFETVKKTLDKYGTSKGFEDVFFTEFLLA
ncbi:MAG: flagellar basal body-associated FliL family protein [Methylococcales bacterium]